LNTPLLEFWFEFASNYSYLSVMRIEREAARHAVSVQWRPFLLGPIFQSFGWATSPFVLQPWKTEYVWQDMARQCRKYALAWQRPSTFPRATLLPARVALLGTGQPWMAEFCRQVMQLNFGADRDISSPACVSEVLACLKLPADQILAEAQAEPNKLRLRAQTELARAKGIFGAPTFFVGEEMFWGNDRLDDALAYAAASGAHR
jgi:2-hydroxychromene-2-carboxylate isomerase